MSLSHHAHLLPLRLFLTSVRRTQVIDDELDYFATNTNQWLSKQERETLQKREQELRELRHASRLTKKITIDFAGRQILAEDNNMAEYHSKWVRTVSMTACLRAGRWNSLWIWLNQAVSWASRSLEGHFPYSNEILNPFLPWGSFGLQHVISFNTALLRPFQSPTVWDLQGVSLDGMSVKDKADLERDVAESLSQQNWLISNSNQVEFLRLRRVTV